tara:strand:+ start:239 stop:394 length:156 start_codon:yes stop_codon:yes gene_type:complete
MTGQLDSFPGGNVGEYGFPLCVPFCDQFGTSFVGLSSGYLFFDIEKGSFKW